MNRSVLSSIIFSFRSLFGVQDAPLSLEEKVGQLMMVHVCCEAANEDARALIQDTKVGGIIYYTWANGLTSPEQIKTLSLGLQRLAKIPLLIAADQEGGIVMRASEGFTCFPGNKALGMTGDPNLAEKAAFTMGQELLSVGINMNLAPVVDVNSNPRNPIIGMRSFGETPELVSGFGKKALDGYNRAGVIATLKHFPGHGDTAVDSHAALPVVNKSLEELEAIELRPFKELAPFADVIMTAHLLVPALDPEHCSTLSEKTLALLKGKMGFQGVIITDSLTMEGVLKQCGSVSEAAIRALNAGSDILLFGGKELHNSNTKRELTVREVQDIHASLVNAVRTGRVQEKRVDEAVQKILQLKTRLSSSQDLAYKIASLAIQKVQTGPIPPLHNQTIGLFAPEHLRKNVEQTSLSRLGKQVDARFFTDGSNVSELKRQAQEVDVLLILSYNAWKSPAQEALIRSLLEMGKPVILVCTRDPLDASLFPAAPLILNTFSPTVPSLQAVYGLLN